MVSRVAATALVVAASAAAIAGCGANSDAPPAAQQGRLLLRGGPAPALAALPDGDLLVGFLQTGVVWRVPRDGPPRRAYPRLRVSTSGQRGLLSLAVLDGHVYAAWTTPGRRLVVGRLRRAAAPVIVWRGVTTMQLANGGHLSAMPGGRLAIGIGDRQAGRPVGRMLSLRPGGPAGQAARTLSTGWNNPFAFTFTSDGRLWVADNAPGRAPERLARGDTGGAPLADVSVLTRRPAPSGLAAIGRDELALCGVVSATLDRYVLAGGRWRRTGTIARGCRYGVVRLADGRLAFSADDGVRMVDP